MSTSTEPRITPAMITETVGAALRQMVERFNTDHESQVWFEDESDTMDDKSGNKAMFTIDGGQRYGAHELTLIIDDL